MGCGLTDAAASLPKLFDDAIDQLRTRQGSVVMRVLQVHGFPFESTQLMEGLHLDPLDVLHGSDKLCDALNIGWIVGQAWHQRESHPNRLAHVCQPFGE